MTVIRRAPLGSEPRGRRHNGRSTTSSRPNGEPSRTIRKAVIPVAGLGTRFLPATKAQPKEMLTLVDKPIIQYIVEEAVASGISDIILVTGQSKRAIEDHFDRNFELEYRLRQQGKHKTLTEMQAISNLANFIYVRQKRPAGLGDAIRVTRHLIGEEPFAVLLGDDIIDAKVPALRQMMRVYERYRDPVIGVTEVAAREVDRYGIIEPRIVEERVYEVRRIVEKPDARRAPSRLAVTGRYILTPEIFGLLKEIKPGRGGEIQLTDALRALLAKRNLLAYQYQGEWFDCGDKLSFLKATVHFALKHNDLAKPFKQFLRRTLKERVR